MTKLTRNRTWAVFFAVLTVGASAVPFVAPTHVNELLRLPSLEDVPPADGGGPLDSAVAQAGKILDPLIGDVNEQLVPRRAEPEVPATYFHDSFDPAARVGGIGVWQMFGEAGDGWLLDPSAARTGNLGERFWDPATGYYPVLTNQGVATLHGFLASPRISLTSLPVAAEAANRRVEADAQAPLGSVASNDSNPIRPHEVVLEFFHRYNFAAGRDGARVEVFTEAPTVETILTDGTPLQPYGVELGPVEALGGWGFTGTSSQYERVQFSLGPWVGKDVWIVLHAASVGIATSREDYFRSGLFGSQTFFGWMVDDARVEGPAHAHNVRLEDLLYPGQCSSASACAFPSGPAEEPLRILVVNRGQFSENVTTSLRIRELGPCTASPEPIRLRPGQVWIAEFECGLNFDDGTTLHADFSARTPEGVDLFPEDNERSVRLSVRRGLDVRFARPPEVTPRLGHPNDVRSVSLTALNLGVGIESVFQEVLVEQRNGDEWVDVTSNPEPIVLNLGTWTAEFELAPPPGSNSHDTYLEVLLREAGEYRIRARLLVDGALVHETEVRAGTLTAKDASYSTSFDGVNEIDDIVRGPPGSPFREWTAKSLINLPPPILPDRCAEPTGNPSGPPCFIWEFGREPVSSMHPRPLKEVNCAGFFVLFAPCAQYYNQFQGDSVSLVGRPQQGFVPDESFARIEVEVVHRMQHRCHRVEFRPSDCQVDVSTSGNAPNQLTTVASRVELFLADSNASLPFDSILMPVRRSIVLQEFHSARQMARTDPYNRHSFYGIQWIHEKFGVDPTEFSQQLDTFRPELVSGLSLRFTHYGADNPSPFTGGVHTPRCPSEHIYCPQWQIQSARVMGITVAGERVDLIRTTGVPGEEIGTWETPTAHDGGGQNPRTPSALAGINPWRQRPLAELVPPVTEFRRFSGIVDFPQSAGVWTTSDPIDLAYRDQRNDLLMSPALEIPSDAGQPTLQFRHMFNLIPGTEQADDSVQLFMRFVRDAGSSLEPDSPWLLLAIRYGMRADPPPPLSRAAQKFFGSDCTFYGVNHPDGPACSATPMRLRAMTEAEIPLDRIFFLDYRDVLPARPNGGTFGKLSDPDVFAMRGPIDLRDCDGRPCIVQFAFRLETPTFKSHSLAADGEGWWLGEFRVINERRAAHDVSVVDLALDATYDWRVLKLGPGTPATFRATVANRGLFRETEARAVLRIQNAENDENRLIPVPEPFAVDVDQEVSLQIPFTVPTTPGEYRFLVSVVLDGELKPGLPLVDGNPGDNCATIDGSGAVDTSVCQIALARTVEVRASPSLALAVAVTPRAGRSDFPRVFHVDITNSGNVPVDGWQLRRVVTKLDGGESEAEAWTLLTSPGPGETRGWEQLEMNPPARIVRALGPPGRYLVSFVLTNGDDFATGQILLEGFENVYTDSFEPLGAEFSEFASGALTAGDDAWTRQSGISFSDGNFAWHFGDAARGTYPAGADSYLELPRIDLSSASRASLAFAHNYSLEKGFDGGRVELSLDDGTTWRPLASGQGHPGSVYADSSLNLDHDPTLDTRAYTGSSLGQSPHTEGWVLEEISLGSVPELVTKVEAKQLGLAGFTNTVRRLDAPNDWITFSETWSLTGLDCLDFCWYRENLRHRFVEPDPASHAAPHPLADASFWWTGMPAGAGSFKGALELPVNIHVPSQVVEGEETIREVRFGVWSWANGAQALAPRVGGTDLPLVRTTSFSDSGWIWNEYLLSGYRGQDITVTLATGVAVLGVAVDDVYLDAFVAGQDGRRVVSPEHSFSIPTADSRWGAPTRSSQVPAEMFWRATTGVPPIPEAWGVQDALDHHGTSSRVWRLGSIGADGRLVYPRASLERLVTPLISLRGVAGDEASVSFWESHELEPGDEVRVLAQQLVPTPSGNVPGPWQVLSATNGGNTRDCPTANNWCQRVLDLSPYVGREIRIAFEFHEDGVLSTGTFPNGRFWAVNEVSVSGETLAGQPVRIRFHASTDRSISEGGWSIDNIQVVATHYKSNIAILPDEVGPDFVRAPGGFVNLTGVLRNLARGGSVRELYLGVEVQGIEGPTGTPPPPTIAFHDVTNRLPIFGDRPATLGPATLLAAGTVNTKGELLDRIPFNVSIQLPDASAAPSGEYEVRLVLLQDSPEGLRPHQDEVQGDHQRRFSIRVEQSQSLDLESVQIQPMTAAVGEPVTIRLLLRNSGTQAALGSASLRILNVETLREEVRESGNLAVAPGNLHTLSFQWVPSDAGMHRVELNLTEQIGEALVLNPIATVGHILAGRLPIYYQEGFEDPEGSFDGSWSVSHGCDPFEPLPNCWHVASPDAFEGAHSVQLGPPPEQAVSGATYGPNLDRSLTGPGIDLVALGTLNQQPGSPFDPTLAFRYRSTLGAGDGVIVLARREGVDPGFYQIRGTPGRSYTGTLPSNNPLGGAGAVQPWIPPARPAIVGVDDRWQVAEFPLAGAILETGPGTFQPLLGNPARLALRFGSNPSGQSTGFAVDAFTISAYDVEVLPSRQEVSLVGGADKTFYFRVENTGGADDTYHVRVDPAFSQFPPFFDVHVLTPTLALTAGAAGLAAVRVSVPDADGLPASFQNVIGLSVASSVDPNRIARAEIRVESFVPTLLPDLAVELKRGNDATGPIVEGDQLNLLVSVRNQGSRPSRQTDLVVFACPDGDGDLAQDVQRCADGEAIPLGNIAVPALPSIADAGFSRRALTRFSQTVNWVPALGDRGEYHIVAIVDPEEFIRQFDRTNDVATQALEVLAIERPDLRVVPGSLEVLNEAGEPVHHVFVGDVVRIRGEIENAGNADAHDVFLRLINQFPLVEQSLPVVFPGQRIKLATSWVAQSGNWVVVLEGSTTTHESTSLNNVEKWGLTVRQGRLLVAFDPPMIHLEPGESQVVSILVTNGRDGQVDATFSLTADPGLAIEGVPPPLTLPRGARDAVPLMLTAAASAGVQEAQVRVGVASGPGKPFDQQATLRVFVGQERLVTAVGEPLAMAPGFGTTTLRLVNQGTAPEAVQILARAPSGWSAEAQPALLALEAGSSREVPVRIDAPPGTGPGIYEVELWNEATLLARIPVLITASPSWQSIVQSVQGTSGGSTVWLLVQNVGNAAGTPDLAALAFNDSRVVRVEPLPGPIEPGGARTFAVTVAAPAQGSTSVALALPGLPEPFAVDVRVRGSAVQVTRLDVLPARGASAGDAMSIRARIQSAPDTATAELPVYAYVDGKLILAKRAVLAPGESADVEFPWRATPGAHVATVGIGSGGSIISRSSVFEVAPGSASTPGLGLLALGVALAVAVAARRRRRDLA